MNHDLLIAFASWEDRFRLGFSRNLDKSRVRRALIFYFSSYADRTRENREAIVNVCGAENIEYTPVELDIDKPAHNWRKVLDSIGSVVADCQNALIDISTMPREIIWYALWLLNQNSMSTRYIYHSPDNYGNAWLSRDPRSPRLVYKLSGIAAPSVKTALLIIVGFDPQRAERLISWCEPAKLMIGIQNPSRFERNEEAMKDYDEIIKKFGGEYDCDIFELDAYAEDRGMAVVERMLKPLDCSYNVIMSSLGPKLTAITLYRLQRKQQNRGLVYAPSNEFNQEYSIGIGECFEGTFQD